MSVSRHIRGVSEATIPSPRTDRQSWGCGRWHPDHTAPSPTATRTAKPSATFFCQLDADVLAAAACDSLVTTRACRLPTYMHDHHDAPSLLLFGKGCRDCFWYSPPGIYVVTDPVLSNLLIVCDRCYHEYN